MINSNVRISIHTLIYEREVIFFLTCLKIWAGPICEVPLEFQRFVWILVCTHVRVRV